MFQRRARDAGRRTAVCNHTSNHTSRATGITAYLDTAAPSKTPRPWSHTKVPVPQSFTIAPTTRSRSMRLKQLEFNPDDSAVPAAKLTGAILPLLPNRALLTHFPSLRAGTALTRRVAAKSLRSLRQRGHRDEHLTKQRGVDEKVPKCVCQTYLSGDDLPSILSSKMYFIMFKTSRR
jgi:hypothetical protein